MKSRKEKGKITDKSFFKKASTKQSLSLQTSPNFGGKQNRPKIQKEVK